MAKQIIQKEMHHLLGDIHHQLSTVLLLLVSTTLGSQLIWIVMRLSIQWKFDLFIVLDLKEVSESATN